MKFNLIHFARLMDMSFTSSDHLAPVECQAIRWAVKRLECLKVMQAVTEYGDACVESHEAVKALERPAPAQGGWNPIEFAKQHGYPQAVWVEDHGGFTGIAIAAQDAKGTWEAEWPEEISGDFITPSMVLPAFVKPGFKEGNPASTSPLNPTPSSVGKSPAHEVGV